LNWLWLGCNHGDCTDIQKAKGKLIKFYQFYNYLNQLLSSEKDICMSYDVSDVICLGAGFQMFYQSNDPNSHNSVFFIEKKITKH